MTARNTGSGDESASNGNERRSGLRPTTGGARNRILVVDDDPIVLRSVQRAMRAHFEVVLAEGAEEALEVLREDRDFDVFLLDLSMPGLDGIELYERVRELDPELLDRVFFCTGGTVTEREKSFLDGRESRVFWKPVDIQILRTRLDDALAGACDTEPKRQRRSS